MITINVEVDPGGQVRIEVNGAVGQDCTQLTQQLIDALGISDGLVLKPEAYQTSTTSVNQQELCHVQGVDNGERP
jgi:hypothetical protein